MDKNTSPLEKALEAALDEHAASEEVLPSATVRVGPHPDALNPGEKNGDDQ